MIARVARCCWRPWRSKPPVPRPFPAARRSASRRGRRSRRRRHRRPHRAGRLPAAAARGPECGAQPKPRSACRSIPGAQFIASYDAGRGQRFYLFGSAASFDGAGDVLPDAAEAARRAGLRCPATHEFDIGRFREETMAFPPSVTIKDYRVGGVAGLPEPEAGRAAGTVPDHHPDRAGHGKIGLASWRVGD